MRRGKNEQAEYESGAECAPYGNLRYAAGLGLGLILALGCYVGLVSTLSGDAETYTTVHVATWYQRKSEAMERTPAPRVVFVGGSNVLYGVDAEAFQRLTGNRAVNAGTHAALHTAYFFDWVKRHAQTGDLVVLCLEYHSFNAGEPTSIFANFLVNRDLHAALRLPLRVGAYAVLALDWDQFAHELRRNATPSWRKGIDRAVKENVAETIGPQGDYRGHFRNRRGPREAALIDKALPEGLLSGPMVLDEGILADLRDLKAWCDERGVGLVAVAPSTLDFPAYHTDQSIAGQSLYALAYQATGIPLLEQPSSEIRPRDDFYDTVYHLTFEGMQAHTERLARLLRDFLPR
jgi:hypothetical protein